MEETARKVPAKYDFRNNFVFLEGGKCEGALGDDYMTNFSRDEICCDWVNFSRVDVGKNKIKMKCFHWNYIEFSFHPKLQFDFLCRIAFMYSQTLF